MHKYSVVNLDTYNSAALLLLAIVSLLSLSISRKSPLLSIGHTTELRGLGAVLIVIGHVWYHLFDSLPRVVLSGPSVALFFFLSGYGLTQKYSNEVPTFIAFFRSRLKRIMIPYWIITIIALPLDYFLGGISYNMKDVVMTLLGVNLSGLLTRIDYVRWYLTLLLLWYVIFYFTLKKYSKHHEFILLLIGFSLFLMDQYFDLVWYQILSFPFGVLVSRRTSASLFRLERENTVYFAIILLTSLLLVAVKFVLEPMVERVWLLHLLREFEGIMFTIALILITGLIHNRIGRMRLLYFFGVYSYEIFLLHGLVLFKLAFFRYFIEIAHGAMWLGFLFDVVMTIFLALCLNKISKYFG